MFAVVFLQAVTLHLETAPPDDPNFEGMNTYFHSLPMALLTLFMTITGGISWWDVVKLFLDVSLVYVVLYALFVVIMLLAVMNIITGIFVSDAVERVSMDRDMVSEAETERNAHHIKVLRDLFYEIDKDGSNSITLDELMHICKLRKSTLS